MPAALALVATENVAILALQPPLSPPTPFPPRRAKEGANSRMWPTLGAESSSCTDANLQTCQKPRDCVSALTLASFTLKVGRAP